MQAPLLYRPGFENAQQLNPELAASYMAQTHIGDPMADAAIASLVGYEPREVHRLLQAGMDGQDAVFQKAPQPLRDFFEQIAEPPPWFNPAAVYPGCRAFHDHSDLFIPAFFVVTLQNAATLISRAFYLTGRVLTGYGPRRIRQNTRHFIEIMLPGALERYGDGWKLSVRIRLVHAQIRHLLLESDDWDVAACGMPLSAAHMGLASANFSATMLRQAERLGARLDAEARESFMQIWRYASYLIGTPESLLFEGDEAQTHELYRIARVCEPPPGPEAVAIANALVNALPAIAGITDPDGQQAMTSHTYRVSRALLGDEMADRLEFPRQHTAGLLPWLRCRRNCYRMARRLAPGIAERWRGRNFVFLLDAAQPNDLAGYRLPDHLAAERATPW